MDSHLPHPVILEGLPDGAVEVEDGLVAVGAGARSGGGAKVDLGNKEAYLHR
jgi:hypothetical protein